MKLFILFIFTPISFLAQEQLTNSVEFALKDKDVILYKDYRYHPADTLERLNRMYEVYLMQVDTCVPNFCRLQSYYTLPYMKGRQESETTYWVENENLESALSGAFSIYKEPFLTSKENLKLKVEDYSDIYFKVNIIDISKNWVKIKFKINDQELIGWVVNTSLCPLKHTVCNFVTVDK